LDPLYSGCLHTDGRHAHLSDKNGRLFLLQAARVDALKDEVDVNGDLDNVRDGLRLVGVSHVKIAYEFSDVVDAHHPNGFERPPQVEAMNKGPKRTLLGVEHVAAALESPDAPFLFVKRSEHCQ
jgi:hypothetical protein